MPLVARVTFLVLVAATFAAFFVAQRLKSSPPVIDVKHLARYFSPNGDGHRDINTFSVTLRSADDVTVDVVDAEGDPVKRLADGVHVGAYHPLRLAWKGDTDGGPRAGDGRYRLRVALREEGRSAIVQQTINVDTRAPRSEVCIGVRCRVDQAPNVVAPGEAPIRIYIQGVSPHYPTTFNVLRTDQGAPKQVAQFKLGAGSHRALWTPTTPLDPGTYLVQAVVRDTAGNVGVTPARVEVGTVPGRPGLTVRGIGAQLPLRPVTAGQRMQFFVDARKRPYRWRVRRVGESAVRKRGTASDPHLSITAPRGASGAYLLELQSGRFRTSVPFLVQSEKRSSVLVVVPAITWLGEDSVDDPPFDGIPNTLSDGGVVHWPRVLVGMPQDFANGVAPLLVFLDRHRIRYDLTSDLDLDLTRNPRASDRPGVLFAGSERWITRALARRLRSFVSDGGRVATFGTDTLRRTVTLRANDAGDAGTLSRATSAATADPFGARVGKLRTLPAPATLSQFDGESAYGLMEGATDLPGFTGLEESAPVTGGKLLAAVGEPLTDQETATAEQSGKPARDIRPALTAVQLGKGVVIRVGLPEWSQRLGDPNVAQVTRNIIDLLRKVQPRIRSTR